MKMSLIMSEIIFVPFKLLKTKTWNQSFLGTVKSNCFGYGGDVVGFSQLEEAKRILKKTTYYAFQQQECLLQSFLVYLLKVFNTIP